MKYAGFTALALAAGIAITTGEARAQEAADTAAVVPYELEGITVTVTRGREKLLRLPYAVSVLGPTQIQGFERTVSLDESLLAIPGVYVYNRYNFALGNRISIRGYGSRSQFGVRGIRIMQDGIPLTMADGQAQLTNLDLEAAGRIEVIRGSASSLYGNAAGGVIAVETEEPPFVAFKPELRISGGGFGNDRFYQKFDLKGLGRAGRFDYVGHVSHFDSDGFRLHSRAQYTLFNTRLRYHPDSHSTLTAIINYANTPRAENPSSLTDSIARIKPDTARDLALSPEECPPNPGFGGCQNLGESSKQGQAGLAYTRRFAGAHQLRIAAYGLFRELDNPIPFTLINLDRGAVGARIEYRYTPRGILSALTAGVDLDHLNDDRSEFFRDDAGVGDIQLDQQESVTGLGLFANATITLGRRLDLTASARYDRVRFDVEDRLARGGGGDPNDSGSRTLDQLSPMIGLTYAPARWLVPYVNIGRGFQTPTTTEFSDPLGGFNQDLKPESSTNYEVGAKGAVSSRLSYTLALYLIDIEDQLIGFEIESIDRTFFTNAGSSTNTGFEADIAALLAPGLTLTGAYTYSNFEFSEFTIDEQDFSGNRVPGIPPHQFRGQLAYATSMRLSGLLRVTAVDGYFVDNANQNTNGGYATVDLRFGYKSRGRFRFVPFLGIDNVFDARYNASVVVNAFGGRFFEPAPGRNIYLGFQVQYE